ncbi:hypothetical protein RB620_13595 [Paenibacillus sp. LHD-117]|uniref:hypothetical protein n=1 Tax=Paenibacillus sp. LHD-117 TaxID=3071412 RepID=UPI0027E172F3|nr:hypothetical protein [Paenibacillus sp. LHD-117]MDQ6420472.1 hypothetical protein [Paenibacillus sp. LHD-117]
MNNDTFLDPWQISKSEKFLVELRKEVCADHVLYNKILMIVARRRDRDEYLFRLINEGKFAQVHLTWRGAVEPDPFWPVTELFDSFDVWAETVMKQDNLKYGEH